MANGVMVSPAMVVAAVLLLAPFFFAAFCSRRWARLGEGWAVWARLVVPAILSVAYVLVASSAGMFQWSWFALYAVLPVLVTVALWLAARMDAVQRGTWLDFAVLAALGLAVDLRWFEPAWPARMAVFNKMLLLDAGLYGFLAVRRLDGVGFDLRLRWRDVRVGLREWVFYLPIAVGLGLWLGFLHWHGFAIGWRQLGKLPMAAVFTFLFVAVPEEVFFRGWLQNLLERKMGRSYALILTAVLFGLSHFNKRTAHFNWRYVLLAAIAGIFYGRAWRAERRVGASAVTHALVDTVWGFWLR
ncbi:hypothetical protein GCM10011507_30800 [Edaphobacter acidisoli]|uniref:CAAX prenyl protease 2/Lysostaphin resistance protein A-like domain-containing protein n=1 Tax=Edaphobacter acidisoli TaxID=2040573 RepID=A0A916W966_9BACT|nr:CPBP family intramembrane glutamic endopeptidase [Edaphobacter acidisoli]GGA77354.1 hypothetical protein GCM10011507_30800 [Edaphobacter acidisoli]